MDGKTNWAIIDSKGTIFTGTQEQMEEIFYNTVNNISDDEHYKVDEWDGDLLLIEIHNITR